jgi:hypothetical protein
MSRGQQTFKQRDLTKALKATVNAGIAVERVEIDKEGKIVIVPARPEDAADQEKPGKNECAEVLQGGHPPKSVQAFIDRNGKSRFHFRRPVFKPAPLQAPRWSPRR